MQKARMRRFRRMLKITEKNIKMVAVTFVIVTLLAGMAMPAAAVSSYPRNATLEHWEPEMRLG